MIYNIKRYITENLLADVQSNLGAELNNQIAIGDIIKKQLKDKKDKLEDETDHEITENSLSEIKKNFIKKGAIAPTAPNNDIQLINNSQAYNAKANQGLPVGHRAAIERFDESESMPGTVIKSPSYYVSKIKDYGVNTKHRELQPGVKYLRLQTAGANGNRLKIDPRGGQTLEGVSNSTAKQDKY